MQLFPKIASGMASSLDSDQTAPSEAVWSGSKLFAYAILSDTLVYEILGHLLYCLTQDIFGTLLLDLINSQIAIDCSEVFLKLIN